MALSFLHNGALLSYKKNKITPFAEAWREVETGVLSKVSYTEKDTYPIRSLQKKMIQMNLFKKQNRLKRFQKETYHHQRGNVVVGNELRSWD